MTGDVAGDMAGDMSMTSAGRGQVVSGNIAPLLGESGFGGGGSEHTEHLTCVLGTAEIPPIPQTLLFNRLGLPKSLTTIGYGSDDRKVGGRLRWRSFNSGGPMLIFPICKVFLCIHELWKSGFFRQKCGFWLFI